MKFVPTSSSGLLPLPPRGVLVLFLALLGSVVLACPSSPEREREENDEVETNGAAQAEDPFAEREPVHSDDASGTSFVWREDFDPVVREAVVLENELKILAPQPISSVRLDGEVLVEPMQETVRLELSLEPKQAEPASKDQIPSYHLEVYTEEAEGEVRLSEFRFVYTLDLEPPVIELLAPEMDESGVVYGTKEVIELVFRISDDAGLGLIRFDGEHEGQEQFDLESAPLALERRLELELEEGEHELIVHAHDLSGRESEQQLRLVCDHSLPRIWFDDDEILPEESPRSLITRERSIGFVVSVADPYGIATVELDGEALTETVEPPAGVAAEADSYEVGLSELEQGWSHHRLEVLDRAGNARMIRFSVKVDPDGEFVGSATLPDGVGLPPFPTAVYGLQRVGLEGNVDGHGEEVVRRLQLLALVRSLEEYFAASGTQLASAPQIQRAAAEKVYLAFDEFEELEDNTSVHGAAYISKLDLIRIAQQAGLWIAEESAPQRIIGESHGTPGVIPATGRVDAVAVSDDETQAFLALRNAAGGLEIASLDLLAGQHSGEPLESTLRWGRLERLRTDPTSPALILMGHSRGGSPQAEWVPLDGGEPQMIDPPTDRLAFHPQESRFVHYDGERGDWRHFEVPALTESYAITAQELLRAEAIGFSGHEEQLVALGTRIDHFGIEMPGALALIDPYTGEVNRVIEHQERLLATLRELEPIAALEEGAERIASIERRLDARVAEAGTRALLTTNSAAIALDLQTGELLSRPFPTREMAAQLGGRLRFELDPTGHTALVHSRHGTLVLDLPSGLELARLDHQLRLAEQRPLALELAESEEGLIVQAIRLPDAPRDLDVSTEQFLRRGNRLGVEVEIHAELLEQAHRGEFSQQLTRSLAPSLVSYMQRHGYGYSEDRTARQGEIFIETWVEETELRARASLVGPGSRQRLGRYHLGTWEVPHNGAPSQAIPQLVEEIADSIEPLPERLFPLMQGMLDLPVRIRDSPQLSVEEEPEQIEDFEEFEEFEEEETREEDELD